MPVGKLIKILETIQEEEEQKQQDYIDYESKKINKDFKINNKQSVGQPQPIGMNFTYNKSKTMKENMVAFIFIQVKLFSEQLSQKYDLKSNKGLNKMLTMKHDLIVNFINENGHKDNFELKQLPRYVFIKCFQNNFFTQTAIHSVLMDGREAYNKNWNKNVDESKVKKVYCNEEENNFLIQKLRNKIKMMEKKRHNN